jgi:hypothetical protein
MSAIAKSHKHAFHPSSKSLSKYCRIQSHHTLYALYQAGYSLNSHPMYRSNIEEPQAMFKAGDLFFASLRWTNVLVLLSMKIKETQ